MQEDMDDLFCRYGTDKGSIVHDYGPTYSELFEPYRSDNITLLEIGVAKGESIAVWSDYFPNGKTVGVDIDLSGCHPNLWKRFESSENCCLIEANATSPEILKKLTNHAPFNFIIDDGSHLSTDVIKSFELLFYEVLKPGGYYIIEDLNCSYFPRNGFIFKLINRLLGGNRSLARRKIIEEVCRVLHLPGPGVIGNHEQHQTMNYFKNILDDINFQGKNICGRTAIQSYIQQTNNKNEKYVDWIQFRRKLIIIKKTTKQN